MKIHHDKHADAGGDEAEKFNLVVARYSAGEVFGDLAIKYNDGATNGKNDKT